MARIIAAVLNGQLDVICMTDYLGCIGHIFHRHNTKQLLCVSIFSLQKQRKCYNNKGDMEKDFFLLKKRKSMAKGHKCLCLLGADATQQTMVAPCTSRRAHASTPNTCRLWWWCNKNGWLARLHCYATLAI